MQDALLEATGRNAEEGPDIEGYVQQLQADLSKASAEVEQERAFIELQEKALIERDALIRDYEGQVAAHFALCP